MRRRWIIFSIAPKEGCQIHLSKIEHFHSKIGLYREGILVKKRHFIRPTIFNNKNNNEPLFHFIRHRKKIFLGGDFNLMKPQGRNFSFFQVGVTILSGGNFCLPIFTFKFFLPRKFFYLLTCSRAPNAHAKNFDYYF